MASMTNAQKMHTTKWESGMLDRRTKVGVWEYFGITGSKEMVVMQRYDHTANKLLFYRPVNNMNFNTEAEP